MIIIGNNQSTVARIKELIDNLRYLSSLPEESEAASAYPLHPSPLSVLSIASFIAQKKLSYEKKGQSNLDLITFNAGMSIAGNKPLIHVSLSGLSKQEIDQQVRTLTAQFLKLLNEQIITNQDFLALLGSNTLGFLLGELFDNIEEHSHAKNVYLSAQYWPETEILEICLVDDGQGLYNSLKAAGADVTNSADALQKVIQHNYSAKTEFGERKRGTGIRNTRRVVTSTEIGGDYFIMTGEAAFLHSEKELDEGTLLLNFPDFSWQGTIVMARLYKPSKAFDLYQYISM